VNGPGIYEVPMGTKYSELIYQYGGGILGGKAMLSFAPSGPSAGYLPASMAELPLDWTRSRRQVRWWDPAPIVVCARGGACWIWR